MLSKSSYKECKKTRSPARNLIGEKFGRLTVLYIDKNKKSKHRKWICLCNCGQIKSIDHYHLTSGATRSCGCYSAECSSKRGYLACDDIANQRFGRLVAVKKVLNVRTENTWLFKCDCGNTITIRVRSVKNKGTKSCGCLNSETRTKHGLSYHPLCPCWYGMLCRCHNKNSKNYKNYGAKGVSVCDYWRDEKHGLSRFVKYMGERPEGHSIDRIDPFGNYEPGNVRFATVKEQANNKRRHWLLSDKYQKLLL